MSGCEGPEGRAQPGLCERFGKEGISRKGLGYSSFPEGKGWERDQELMMTRAKLGVQLELKAARPVP